MTIETPPQPVRNHRRRALADTRWAGPARSLGAAALILLTLGIGSLIVSHTPDQETQEKPFLRHGSIGRTIDARTFDATVLGVRGAALVAQDGQTHDTSGVWLLVRVRLTGHRDPLEIGYAELVDTQGRGYRATERISENLIGGRSLEPGVPVEGEIAFEVPVSVATGLSLRLAKADFDQRRDTMIDVPLRIQSSQVNGWLAGKAPISLAEIGAAT